MRTLFLTLILTTVLTTPLMVGAASDGQDFVPLVGIPFVDEFNIDENSPGLSGYVNSLYRAAIIVAAVLAVAKIVIAGVQYMITDIGTQKGQAKKTIRGAVFGLLLVIGAVLVLETINPTLTSLNSLSGLQGITGTQEQVTVSLPSGQSIDDEANRRFGEGNWKQVDCAFWRWEIKCSIWCENNNGMFIPKGITLDSIDFIRSGGSFAESVRNEGTHQCIVSNAADRATAAAVEARGDERARAAIERQTREAVPTDKNIISSTLTAAERQEVLDAARRNDEDPREALHSTIDEMKETAAASCGVDIDEVAEILQPGGMSMTFLCAQN